MLDGEGERKRVLVGVWVGDADRGRVGGSVGGGKRWKFKKGTWGR